MLPVYEPSLEDFEYFCTYYKKGGVYENKHLLDVSMDEFCIAVKRYQTERMKLPVNRDDKLAPFREFASIERELIRDQLLYSRGFPVIGYIFAPPVPGCDMWGGIEHLKK